MGSAGNNTVSCQVIPERIIYTIPNISEVKRVFPFIQHRVSLLIPNNDIKFDILHVHLSTIISRSSASNM
eukprot:1861441-Rhodomonas_salina.1